MRLGGTMPAFIGGGLTPREAEAAVRRAAERPGALFVDARWIAALGRERIQEIVQEYGFGPLKNWSGEETVRAS